MVSDGSKEPNCRLKQGRFYPHDIPISFDFNVLLVYNYNDAAVVFPIQTAGNRESRMRKILLLAVIAAATSGLATDAYAKAKQSRNVALTPGSTAPAYQGG